MINSRLFCLFRNSLLSIFISCSAGTVVAETAKPVVHSPSRVKIIRRPPITFDSYIESIISAWKGHRQFAEWLVNEMKPTQIVDLGVDYGYSTFVFSYALKENGISGTVTGIDFFGGDHFTGIRDTYSQVLNIVNQFSLKNVEIIKGDFTEISKTWNRPIDILHIDGDHTYEAVLNDYTAWSPFVHEDGIILFHDVNVPNPEFQVVNFFRELSDGHKLYFLHSAGLGIITKNEKLAQRIKEQFSNVYDFLEQPL